MVTKGLLEEVGLSTPNTGFSRMLEFFQKEKGGLEKQRWHETGRLGLPSQGPPQDHMEGSESRGHLATSTIDTKAQQGAHTKEAHRDESNLPPSPHFFPNPLNMIRNFQVRTQFRIKPSSV